MKVELIVYACMFLVLYINWTDFPKQNSPREVWGSLERIK